MLDSLGGVVGLLLALLGTAAQTKHEVQRRFFLDVVVGQSPPVLELLAGEDQALLVRGNAISNRRRCQREYPCTPNGMLTLPCPESWPSHYRLCPRTPPLG